MTKFDEITKATSAKTAPRQINQRKRDDQTSIPPAVEDEPAAYESFEDEPAAYSRQLKIATPAGDPPVAPKGYGGTCSQPCFRVKSPWPEGQPTDAAILRWGNAILEHGESDHRVYTPSAVIYFARHFWEINSPEFLHVKALIESNCDEISPSISESFPVQTSRL